MITERNFKDMITIVLIVGIFILGYMIIKPLIMPILFAVFLAYVFYPLNKKLTTKVKNETLSTSIIFVGLFAIIITVLIVLLGQFTSQAVDLYLKFQKTDLTTILKSILPSFISNIALSDSLSGSLNTFISNFIAEGIKEFNSFILNLPVILLKFFVFGFVFFFALRDGKKTLLFLKDLSPLKPEVEKQFFQHFNDITFSVLVGQVVVGIIQGITAGIAYFVLDVPNALVLTLITAITSVVPFIGAWIVWVPVDIYLFTTGNSTAALFLLVYGTFIVSLIDNFLRPILVSRRTKISSAVVIIGMIGGLLVFGMMGLLIGPLILGYILLILELYKKNKNENIFLQQNAPVP